MDKEQEIHSYTIKKPDSEQAFVFNVTRYDDDTLKLNQIFLVTNINGNELKTVINLDNLVNLMLEDVGGNVRKSDYDTIIDIFEEVMPKDVKHELMAEFITDQIESESNNKIASAIIKANEFCQDMMSYDDIIKQIDEKYRRKES